MHYCLPHAIVHQVVHSTWGNSFDYTTNRHEYCILCHDSLNYLPVHSFGYKVEIYHGLLVSCFVLYLMVFREKDYLKFFPL